MWYAVSTNGDIQVTKHRSSCKSTCCDNSWHKALILCCLFLISLRLLMCLWARQSRRESLNPFCTSSSFSIIRAMFFLTLSYFFSIVMTYISQAEHTLRIWDYLFLQNGTSAIYYLLFFWFGPFSTKKEKDILSALFIHSELILFFVWGVGPFWDD